MGDPLKIKDLREKVFEAAGVTIEEGEEKIRIIQEWLTTQKELPEIPSQQMAERFLILNKFRIEVTQRKLKMYYEMRNKIPEFFKDMHPEHPNMQKFADVLYYLTLPKLSPDLYRVIVMKFKDTNPKHFTPLALVGHGINSMELVLLEESCAVPGVFVCDMQGASIRHLFKFGYGLIKNYATLNLNVFLSRLKAIHFVHGPRFLSYVIALLKTLLNPKLVNRIHVHKTLDTLHDFIPKEVLPSDFGGEEVSLEDLKEYQQAQFRKQKERFDKLATFVSTND